MREIVGMGGYVQPGPPAAHLACPPRGWGARRPCARPSRACRACVAPRSRVSNVEAGQFVALVGIGPAIGDTLARSVQSGGWTVCLFIVHIWRRRHLGRVGQAVQGAHNCHSVSARGCQPTRIARIGPDPGAYSATVPGGRVSGHPGGRRAQDGPIRCAHQSAAGPIRGAGAPASWARADARDAPRCRLSSSNMPSAFAVCSRCAAFRANLYL